MQWFYNLKLSYKLIASFLLVVLITTFLVVSASNAIQELDERDTYMYKECVVSMQRLGLLSEQVGEFKVAFRKQLLADTPDMRRAEVEKRNKWANH